MITVGRDDVVGEAGPSAGKMYFNGVTVTDYYSPHWIVASHCVI